MAKILVFNNDTDRMEIYTRNENDSMPYNTNGTLRVREFRGASKSNILWTTKRTMQTWNSQRYIYGAPISVGFAFRRPYEGGHGSQSHDWVYTVEHMKILDSRKARSETKERNQELLMVDAKVTLMERLALHTRGKISEELKLE